VLISIATLGAFVWGIARTPGDSSHATTLAFMTLAFAQIFHLGNARSGLPVIRPARIISNPYAVAAVALTAGLQVLTVELDPLATVLQTHPLDTDDWWIVGTLSLIPAVMGQMMKLLSAARRASSEVGP
jgi:Ca2+-transporting ATPase